MYYVDASVELQKHIKHLYSLANEQDRGEVFISAFRAIYDRLHNDPYEFGEPLYTLQMLRLHVRTAAILPLVVTYSVSADHPFVIIKSVQLMESG